MEALTCRAPGRKDPTGHTCGTKLGEALDPLRFVGVVLRWNDRIPATAGPRDVRRCPRCGWYNLFVPTRGTAHAGGGRPPVDERDPPVTPFGGTAGPRPR